MNSEPIRLLVVEDEPPIAQLLQEVFERFGYEVDLAPTVGAAIDRLQESRYALCLSDFLLPDRTGLDLAHQIVECGFQSSRSHFPQGLRMLLMTAYLEPELEEEVERHPVILQTVRKPMDVFALKSMVDELVGDSASSARMGG